MSFNLAELLDQVCCSGFRSCNQHIPQRFSYESLKSRGGAHPCPRVKEKRSNGINIRNDDVHPTS